MPAGSRDASTVAPEAAQLEQALRAAGLDPDAHLAWPVWDAFTHKGLRVALAMLQKKGTNMEIRFNPDSGWADAAKYDSKGRYQVQRQHIWQQLEPDVWLEVTIERVPGGIGGDPYIAEAIKRSGHQPGDSWRSALSIDRGRLQLVPDTAARPTDAPTAPERSSGTVQQYIDRIYGRPSSAE